MRQRENNRAKKKVGKLLAEKEIILSEQDCKDFGDNYREKSEAERW